MHSHENLSQGLLIRLFSDAPVFILLLKPTLLYHQHLNDTATAHSYKQTKLILTQEVDCADKHERVVLPFKINLRVSLLLVPHTLIANIPAVLST